LRKCWKTTASRIITTIHRGKTIKILNEWIGMNLFTKNVHWRSGSVGCRTLSVIRPHATKIKFTGNMLSWELKALSKWKKDVKSNTLLVKVLCTESIFCMVWIEVGLEWEVGWGVSWPSWTWSGFERGISGEMRQRNPFLFLPYHPSRLSLQVRNRWKTHRRGRHGGGSLCAFRIRRSSVVFRLNMLSILAWD